MNGACVWVGVLGWLASSAALASTTVEPPALPGVRDEAEPEPPAQTEPVEEPTEVEPPDQAEPVEEPTEAQPTEPEPTPEPEPEPEPEPTGETDPFAGGAAATPPPQPTSSPAAAPTASPAPASSAPVQRPTPAATTTTREPTPSAEPEPREAAEDESDPPRESEDEGEEEDKEPIKHRGFIIDFRAGVVGCTKPICKRHRARPGLRLDGMLGRNILGFVDIGLAGAWGTMGTRVDPGTDGLALYGLDPATLPPEAALLMFDQFTVDSARLETIQAGLDLRVHILPRGRFDPYVGVGAQYSLFRGVYGTPAGRTKLGFHGLAFPLQVGFVVFATRRIAFGAQFDWLWSWYGGVTVRGAPGRFAAPIPAISEAAAMAGVKLPGDLPNLWSVGGVVHLRLGKPK